LINFEDERLQDSIAPFQVFFLVRTHISRGQIQYCCHYLLCIEILLDSVYFTCFHVRPGNTTTANNFPGHPHIMTPRIDQLAEAGYVSLLTGKWWEGNFRKGGFTEGMTDGGVKQSPPRKVSSDQEKTDNPSMGGILTVSFIYKEYFLRTATGV
jgi:hypothetical protein